MRTNKANERTLFDDEKPNSENATRRQKIEELIEQFSDLFEEFSAQVDRLFEKYGERFDSAKVKILSELRDAAKENDGEKNSEVGDTVTAAEASKITGFAQTTLRTMARDGRIRRVKRGRDVLLSREDVERVAKNRREEAKALVRYYDAGRLGLRDEVEE